MPDLLESRIAGALLGVHAGDSLGASLEFMSFAQVRAAYPDGLRQIVGGGPFDWPAGHATDDTDLTRAVVLGYLNPGPDLVRSAGLHMLDWFHGNWPGRRPGSRPFDIGGATATGLTRFGQTLDWRRAGAGIGSAGNGSLMRCIPTALVTVHPLQRTDEVTAISAITHDDFRCVLACVAYTEMVVALIGGRNPHEAVVAGRTAMLDGPVRRRFTDLALEFTEEAVAAGPDVQAAASAVTEAIQLGLSIDLAKAVVTGDAGLPHGGTGYVLDSLSLAVAALADPRPAVDALVDVTRLGGDTDTNGAIAGGLLGARDGAAAWPAEWVKRLQFASEFRAAASVFAHRS